MAAEALLVGGRYRIVRRLATGGLSRVWLAADELLDRRVALKKCEPPTGLDLAEQALLCALAVREARAVARIVHPNVVRILDVLPDEDGPWIVMEHVPSRSLLELIQQSGPLPPAQVARIGLAILAGLIAAGEAGVLHLDVKPGNVLI